MPNSLSLIKQQLSIFEENIDMIIDKIKNDKTGLKSDILLQFMEHIELIKSIIETIEPNSSNFNILNDLSPVAKYLKEYINYVINHLNVKMELNYVIPNTKNLLSSISNLFDKNGELDAINIVINSYTNLAKSEKIPEKSNFYQKKIDLIKQFAIMYTNADKIFESTGPATVGYKNSQDIKNTCLDNINKLLVTHENQHNIGEISTNIECFDKGYYQFLKELNLEILLPNLSLKNIPVIKNINYESDKDSEIESKLQSFKKNYETIQDYIPYSQSKLPKLKTENSSKTKHHPLKKIRKQQYLSTGIHSRHIKPLKKIKSFNEREATRLTTHKPR